jgi:hypothetical protein
MSNPVETDHDFPLSVIEEDDGSLALEWDRDHPITSVFNDWTEQDFIDMLTNAAQRTIAEHEAIK